MAVVNEIVTSFGFKGNINPLKDFNKELGGIIPKMKKMTLGMAGAASFGAIMAGLVTNNPLVQSSKRMGEMVKDIQSLELASVKFGANMGVGLSTFENVSKSLAEIQARGQKTFGKFGISIFNEKDGGLKNVNEMLSGVNKLFNSQQRLFGKQGETRVKALALRELGIDESLLNLLMLSTKEYAKQLKMSEQFSLSKGQVKSIEEFNNSLNETKSIVGQISSLVTAEFGGSFKEITDGANDFLKANKDIVLEVSDMVLKIGLVLGSFAALKVLAIGLTSVFKGMFAPLTAAMLAIEGFESGAFGRLTDKISKFYSGNEKIYRPSTTNAKDRLSDIPTLGGGTERGSPSEDLFSKRAFEVISGNRPFFIKNSSRSQMNEKMSQTNNINVYTDSPKVMSDVIENTINKGARVMQETSARGGI